MQDGETVRQYITEVIVKLQRYLDINKDIVKSKSLKYEEFRIKRCKALIDLATKTDVLRKFTISLPGQDGKDNDPIEVDLLEGLKEDALSTNDIDAAAGYINYLLSVNLNTLYKKYSERVKDLQKDSD